MYMIHIPLNDPMLLVTSASQIFADIYAWFIPPFHLKYWYLRHGKNCKEDQKCSPLGHNQEYHEWQRTKKN